MKHFALALILAATAVVGAAPASPAHAQVPSGGIDIPIVGTVPGGGGTFNGVFTLQRFVSSADGVAAVGRLVGIATNTATGAVTTIVRTITLPILPGATQATCDILHLELGPLNLDLLGLQIDLSQIVLDITAQSGAGNLLGNLLCSVAGLLDNPSGLAKLLNQILSILG
jgi:hypothetical protein